MKGQFREVFPCVCGEPIILPHVRCQSCICEQRDALQDELDKLKAAGVNGSLVPSPRVEPVRDENGFALCHHGRPIMCAECEAEL